MDDNMRQNTIGILYPGEMGSSLGKLLVENRLPVITTLEGRSPRTRRLCHQAGLLVLDGSADVLARADVVISLVHPSAALSVARQVAMLAAASGRKLVYVDANSISPMTAIEIAEVFRHTAVDVVDASIHGLASQLRQRANLYLSGPRAGEVADQFGRVMRVKVVGLKTGQASALKMILGTLSKGLIGLFLEAMLLATDLQLLDEALPTCDEFYPGLMEIIRRTLPTYPQHAARRGEELKEVEQTMRHTGMTPEVVPAVRQVTSRLQYADWSRLADQMPLTVRQIIEEVHRSAAAFSTAGIEHPAIAAAGAPSQEDSSAAAIAGVVLHPAETE